MTQGGAIQTNEEAENAVDKDLSTEAVSNTVDGASWLKLEFGQTHFIDKVVIYYRFYTDWYDPNNWCVQSEMHFITCVDDHQSTDVSVYQGEVKQKSCGTLQLTYGLNQEDQIYTLLCDSKGDSVTLSKTTGKMVVFEVVVIGSGTS